MNRRAFRLVCIRSRRCHDGGIRRTRRGHRRPHQRQTGGSRRSRSADQRQRREARAHSTSRSTPRRTSSTRRTRRSTPPICWSPRRRRRPANSAPKSRERAAAVYTQSGSTGGVEDLDSQNAQDLSTRQKYSSIAAQRDKEIVTQLAQAKEQVDAAQGRRRAGAPDRAGAAGRGAGAERQAQRRTSRARAAAVEGDGRARSARRAGRAGTQGA